MDFNKELTRVRYDPTVRLSAIFMQWRERFLVYGSYCANLTKAINTLQEICDNDPDINSLVEVISIFNHLHSGFEYFPFSRMKKQPIMENSN